MNIKNIYLFPNLKKFNCVEYTIQAGKILLENNSRLFMSDEYRNIFEKSLSGTYFGNEDECIKKCDIIIAVGGDGTILKCALKGSVFGRPILGINCGRLGFMASLEHTQLENLAKLFSGEFTLGRRMMLSAQVYIDGEKESKKMYALNDIVVSKSDDCKIADFEVSKSGRVISSLRADGVILSTATGSTAYSMSAGGAIIEPEMECIELTQICPHSLLSRSMILSCNSEITVTCHTSENSHVYVYADGNKCCKISADDWVTVKKSAHYVDLIDINGGSFFTSVNNKLMQPFKDSAKE